MTPPPPRTDASRCRAQVGCTVIEKAATEKAVRDIDVKLGPAVAERQKAKAMGQSFYDAARVGGRFPNALPNLLRPQVCKGVGFSFRA